MATEHEAYINLLNAMVDLKFFRNCDALQIIDNSVKAKTFFELSTNIEIFDSLQGDAKMRTDIPDGKLAPAEEATYKRIRRLNKFQPIEYTRSFNGGYNTMAALLYMTENPGVSLMQASDPKYDVEGKRATGDKLLTLMENSLPVEERDDLSADQKATYQPNPAAFGNKMAAMAKKLASHDYLDEYRQYLELPVGVSSKEFLARMDSRSPEQLAAFAHAMGTFAVGAHQLLSRCFEPAYLSLVDAESAKKTKTTIGKAIYTAFNGAMTDRDREYYARWDGSVRNCLLRALQLPGQGFEEARNNGGEIRGANLIYGALARKEIINAGSFMAVDPFIAESLYAHLKETEIKICKSGNALLLGGLSSREAEWSLLDYLPQDHFARTYFGALTKKDIEDRIAAMARHGRETGLSSLNSLSTDINFVHLMMVVDGFDISRDILSNTDASVAMRRAYARKFIDFLTKNALYPEDPVTKVRALSKQAVENIAGFYAAGVNYCAGFAFPDDFSVDQTEILRVVKSIAFEINQVFDTSKVVGLQEYKDAIGGPQVSAKQEAILMDFQELIRPLAERNDPKEANIKVSDKIRADFAKQVLAGKTIQQLHEIYPPKYLGAVMTYVEAALNNLPGFITQTADPKNEAHIDTFLNGGPLPPYIDGEAMRKCFADAFAFAEKQYGAPSRDMDAMIPTYNEHSKLNPETAYQCISDRMRLSEQDEPKTKLALALFLDAMAKTTGDLTLTEAEAMFPEDLISLVMAESVTKLTEEIDKNTPKNVSLLEKERQEWEMTSFIDGGPLPSFLDKKTVDAILGNATQRAGAQYAKITTRTNPFSVRLLATSDRSDRLPTFNSDYIYYGLKTKDEIEPFNDIVKHRNALNLYLPTLDRTWTRASFADFALMAEGGPKAAVAFINAPNANQIKAEHGVMVKDKLLNHPPVLFDENGTPVPQTENIKWYAEVFKKSAEYILGRPLTLGDGSTPEAAEGIKERAQHMARLAQDHMQVFSKKLRELDEFQNVVGEDIELLRDGIADLAAISQVRLDLSNPEASLSRRLASKVVLDAFRPELEGQSVKRLHEGYPNGYLDFVFSGAVTLISEEFDSACKGSKNAQAVEDFLQGGDLPDFINYERLNVVFYDVQRDAERQTNKKLQEVYPGHPHVFMMPSEIVEYKGIEAQEARKNDYAKQLSDLRAAMQDYQTDPVEKCLMKLAVESLGMSIEEAVHETSGEYVARYIATAKELKNEIYMFKSGVRPADFEEQRKNFRNGEMQDISDGEINDFLQNGEKLPYIFDKYAPRIQENLRKTAATLAREGCPMRRGFRAAGLPVRWPTYEKCPTPPELESLDLLEDKYDKLTVPVDPRYKKSLFELDVKQLTGEAISDGRMAFDEMMAAQFSGLEEPMKNPMVANKIDTPTKLFYIDGKSVEEYVSENVPDLARYSDAEKEVIRKVGVMQALSSGEHIVEVARFGVGARQPDGVATKDAKIVKLQRVGMDLSAFKGMEKWYQSSRKKLQEKTDAKNAAFLANTNAREDAITDDIRTEYRAPLRAPAPAKQRLSQSDSPNAHVVTEAVKTNNTKKTPDVGSQAPKKEKTNEKSKN